jgi:Protein of unknown function (DUF1236)
MNGNKLLIAAAAVSLIAGTSGALAQQEPPRGAPAEKIAPKPGAPGAAQSGGALHKGAADTDRSNAAEQRDNRTKSNRVGEQNRGRSETTGQAPQNERRDQNRATEERENGRDIDRNRATTGQGRETDRGNRNRATEERRNDRNPVTTGQGAAPSRGSNVSVDITPEKRTRMHEVFLGERNAPRLDHTDFDLAVGTPVPRSVRFVPVPRQIIAIEPEWRGYDYFLVADRIVIVDPRSMEIVAIIDV